MSKEKLLYDTLHANCFHLVRKDRHEVWQNENGITVVLSCSPSDQHWAAQALRDLRRKLAGYRPHGRKA